MKKNNIVILGAGVSSNYGFDTGADLLGAIKEGLPTVAEHYAARNSEMFKNVMYLKFNQNGHSNLNFVRQGVLLRQMMDQPQISVDTLINRFDLRSASDETEKEEFSNYILILKLMVIQRIINCEHSSIESLFNPDKFYHYFFTNFLRSKSPDELRNIKIVNFNYDRSFDYAIEQYLIRQDLLPKQLDGYKSKGELPEGFKSRFANLDIVHPYGTVGSYKQVPYGKKVEYHFLQQLSDNIKVIGEERTDESFKEIRDWLRNSNEVVFLGFGFDETNMRNLGYPDMKSIVLHPRVSSYKKERREISRILEIISDNNLRLENETRQSSSLDLIEYFNNTDFKL